MRDVLSLFLCINIYSSNPLLADKIGWGDNMKKQSMMKFLLILTTLFMAFVLSSCDKATTTKEGNTTTTNVTTTTVASSKTTTSTNTSTIISTTTNAYDCISLSEAIALSGETEGFVTDEKYYVQGTITEVKNGMYGNVYISDGTISLYIYGIYSKDGETRYDALEDKPVTGDTVILYGTLGFYKEAEMKNAWLMELEHKEIVDTGDYTQASISEARLKEDDSKVQLTGVVAKITYANGMNPNGFILVDNSSSIYVYGSESALSVSIGNKVTVNGVKSHFTAETEKENAEKIGYRGSLQLTSPIIISNDKGNSAFDTSWIQTSTMKALMETKIDTDFTSLIYQVNAVIKKDAQTGYTNYYINDLDEKSGSYVYTSNNGSDFAYLDEYDGKLVTMYVMVLNAKSTASGHIYRLLPISIVGVYTFDTANTFDFVNEYIVSPQFDEIYGGDPNLELITSYSSSLLGIGNFEISYASSTEDVIYFETVDSKTIMHAKNNGEATITVTESYGGKEEKKEIKLSVNHPVEVDSITVKEAIDSIDTTEVTVKGVIGSAITNRSGFYLIDESGAIAVVLKDATVLSTLKIGMTVIIKGTRAHINKSDTTTVGQRAIIDSVIVTNLLGSVSYSTNSFVTDKTFADIYNKYDANTDDPTTTVFVIKGIITAGVGYGAYTISDGVTLDGDSKLATIQTYQSSNSQYSWITSDYLGKEVTITLALCNWNSKSVFKCCVLAVSDGTNTIYNNYSLGK